MNEKLTERVMDWIANATQQIGDFASREIPPFIVEYLTWKFWENFMHIMIYLGGVGVFAGGVFALYKSIQYCWKKYNENPNASFEIPAVLLTILGGITSIAIFFDMCYKFPTQNVTDCLKIKIAPKVYLVEKAAELIKK